MTVNVSKPALNLREELSALKKPSGAFGEQLLRSESLTDACDSLGTFSFRNLIHNGSMQVAQRGTNSGTITSPNLNIFYIDRWYVARYNTSGTFNPSVSIRQTADHPLMGAYGSCMEFNTEVASTPANPAVDFIQVRQAIEASTIAHLHGKSAKPFTLSFWVKTNKPGSYGIQVRAEGGVSGSNPNIIKRYSVNAANTWEYKTITFPPQNIQNIAGTNGTSGMTVAFNLASGLNKGLDSTISALEDKWYQYSSSGPAFIDQANLFSAVNNYFRITDVQVEVGSSATPFERRPPTVELQLCQRFYYQDHLYMQAYQIAGQDYSLILRHPVEMARSPTITVNAALISVNVSAIAANVIPGAADAKKGWRPYIRATSNGLVEYNAPYSITGEI